MSIPALKLTQQHYTGITADSRKVVAGNVFLAYPGEHADGRQYIAQAIDKGASAVLWESEGFTWNANWQLDNQPVAKLREQASAIAGSYYGQPSHKLWMIGVTGTNGKTSCSHWLAQAYTALGKRSVVIGTLGNGFAESLSPAVNTTPDPILLQAMLADYVAQHAEIAAMEVSSHGLDQHRVDGIAFDVAVLTNLTRDHLDYHGDMAHYAAAKRRLFSFPGLAHAIINHDDAYGRVLANELRAEGKAVLSYGLSGGDVYGTSLSFDEQGLKMEVSTPQGEAEVRAALLGRFNASNLLAVLSVLLVSGVALADAVNALSTLRAAPGRMQQIGGGAQPLVVIDYAHTPDALEKVLLTLREQTQGRLVCVFGCGGDRDKGKRPLMGEVASRLADKVVVTSDNPRNEEPASIVAEISAGLQRPSQIELDRAVAIQTAVQNAQAGDVVLIAGKGHEDYQEIAGVRHAFSDLAVATLALEHAA